MPPPLPVITLKYGDQSDPAVPHQISLTQSPRIVALRVPDAKTVAYFALLAAHNGRELDRRAGFRVALFQGTDAPEITSALTNWSIPAQSISGPAPDLRGVCAYHTSPQDRRVVVPTGRVFVQFEPGVPEADQLAMLAAEGLTVVRRDDADSVVGFTKELDAVLVARRLASNARVFLAEPSLAVPVELLAKSPTKKPFKKKKPHSKIKKPGHFPVNLPVKVTPTDPLFFKQWHLKNVGPGAVPATGVAGADARVFAAWMKLNAAWKPRYGRYDIVVAVLDKEFDLTHPDIGWLAKWIVAPFDFIHNDSNPHTASPTVEHGTQVAGLCVASANDIHVVGVAPNCGLCPLLIDDISDESVEKWFLYVRDKGAAVANCSWKADLDYYPLSTTQALALKRCARDGRGGLGCTICFGAGNYGHPVNEPPLHLNGFAINQYVLGVAGSTWNDEPWEDSSHGPELSVAAPCTGDTRKLTTCRPTTVSGSSGFTHHFGNTSGACAIVSGVALLVLSANEWLTSSQVRNIIRDTARPIAGAPGPTLAGKTYGKGCVDAAAAVTSALAVLFMPPIPLPIPVPHPAPPFP